MPLELGKIPLILEYLVQKGVISPASQSQVEQELKNPASTHKGRAGEVAVSMGVTNERTKQKLQTTEVAHYLNEQTKNKIDAAVADIQTIAASGKQTVPAFLKANWGNNGVSLAQQNPTFADAISAAANSAQNIVMLANDDPSLAKNQKVLAAIAAARALAHEIWDGGVQNGQRKFTNTQLNDLTRELQEGLIEAGKNKPLLDLQGNPVTLVDFIAQRTKEIRAAIINLPAPQLAPIGILRRAGAAPAQPAPQAGLKFSPHEEQVLNWHMGECDKGNRANGQVSYKKDPSGDIHKGVEFYHSSSTAAAYKVVPTANGAEVRLNMASAHDDALREAVVKAVMMHGGKLEFEGSDIDRQKIERIAEELYNAGNKLVGTNGLPLTSPPLIVPAGGAAVPPQPGSAGSAPNAQPPGGVNPAVNNTGTTPPRPGLTRRVLHWMRHPLGG